jgi:gliding motility-associated-like protein
LKTKYSIVLLVSFFTQITFAQLTIQAGPSSIICIGASTALGGFPTASGGTPPYLYNWQPTTFLNNNTIANPTVSGCNLDVAYTLMVVDAAGDTAFAVTNIYFNQIHLFNAGLDTGYCVEQSSGVIIGASNNNSTFHSFNWTPSLGLNNPTLANPLATPTITTTYTLTVSDGKCPDNISFVTVTPFPKPIAYAGEDTTINEGNTITLNGSGGIKYEWEPNYNIKYMNTSNPDVWPSTSFNYTVIVEDQHKCYSEDVVRVNVIKGDILFFYSAFTPNYDGDNDFFYIGNIDKYPDNTLKIYNRYGKVVFSASSYNNTWDGKYLSDEIPSGTYFYVLNDGKEKTYKGTATLIR